ncbi:MAG: phosphate/phosphite/phosphonate ABC transporter substrate-binding protein [Haloferacaceae archaeon]|nr:phosphate/phosphite/phosphonate ABC transporter substrate-binding protein [Haloferacaceae archaeon]
MMQRREFVQLGGAATIVGLAGCTGGSREPYINGEVEFAMNPTEPQDEMEAQYDPLAEVLGAAAGVPATTTYARNYSAILQGLGSGTVDMADTGPFAAALGVNAGQAEIALQRKAYGSFTYASVIVTREDSDIDSLSDLAGRTVGFADRLSASGALFPLFMLKQAGLSIGGLPSEDGGSDFTPTFSSHGAAFEQLEAGQVDAAGVGKFITVGDDGVKSGFRYVKEYDGIPEAPIVTSPMLTSEEKQTLTTAIVDAPASMYHGADGTPDTDDDLWFDDVREAGLDTYQPVIDVALELGIDASLLDG